MRRERKGKTLRKTLGILLSAVMLVSGITFMPGSAIEVQAATTKDVQKVPLQLGLEARYIMEINCGEY